MAQVVLVEENQVLNDLISINLVSFLGIDLVKRKNAEAVLNLLDILPELNLIICQYEMLDENTAEIIQQYIKQRELDIGLIILGGPGNLDNEFTVTIENPKEWEKVIEHSAKILGINEDILAKKIVPDFVPIPVNYFLNLESVCCDVFIRIKQTPTSYQFVKRIHQGDAFSRESIIRYREQGLDNFYIPKDQRKNFATYLSNILVQKLDSPGMGLTHKIDLMGESYDIVTKEILKLGFTTESIQLTDSILTNMIKNAEKSPEMSFLLHKVINSHTPVLFQRCHMTSVIASECLKTLKHNTLDAISAITFASFFHDILLNDQLDLININSTEELNNANLSEEKRNLALNHAYLASQLIRKYPGAPRGAEELMREHHGISHGIGFTSEINGLSALSKIFIIAREFALEFSKIKENKAEAKPIIPMLYKKFPGETSAIAIKALEKALVKKI